MTPRDIALRILSSEPGTEILFRNIDFISYNIGPERVVEILVDKKFPFSCKYDPATLTTHFKHL